MFGNEQAKYEICRKSKIGEYIQSGIEFFIIDMDKKKVYSSLDLRLREIHEKLAQDNVLVVKEAQYQ